jgi:hypothetical protein
MKKLADFYFFEEIKFLQSRLYSLSSLLLLTILFSTTSATARPERTFDLSNIKQTGGFWGPKKLPGSVEMWDTLFGSVFLNSPVGKMVNSSKNPDLQIDKKFDNYAEIKTRSCPPTMANDDGAKHCYTVPTTLDSVVLHGQDAPIKIIQRLHSQSQNFWSKFQAPAQPPMVEALSIDGYQKVAIDVLSIKELNLRAADVWQKLIACNSNNPELARIGFFYSKKEKLCNDGTGTYIFGLLQGLAFNFQEYMISTMPIAEVNSYTDNFDVQIIFKNPHPLLTEFAILNWSVFFNHAGEDKFETSANMTGTMFQFDAFKQDLMMNRGFGESFKRPVRGMQQGAEVLFKEVVNNLIFISMINYDELEHSCSRYGLWPALNRTILYSNLMNFYSGSISRETSFLDEIVKRNCGEKVDPLLSPESSGVYGKYFQSNLLNMRLRYIDYLGDQHSEEH